MPIRYLDVSDLPAPEPFSRILAELAELGDGEALRVEHRKQPLLLYGVLQERGFCFHVQAGSRNAFEIYIWRQHEAPPAGLVLPSIAEPESDPRTCGGD